MNFNKIISKKIELRYFILIILFFIVILIAFGKILKTHLQQRNGYGKIGEWTEDIADFPVLIKQTFNSVKKGSGSEYIIDNKFSGLRGLKYTNSQYTDSGYLLNSYFNIKLNQCVIELFSLKDNKVIHRWVPPVKKIEKDYNISLSFDVRMAHPLLLKDGSIITQFEKGIIRLDSSSKLMWAIIAVFHHSIELDADGNIFCCGNDIYSKYRHPFGIMGDNLIIKISPVGKILWQKSVLDLLIENGYAAIIFGITPVNYYGGDNLHLNEIRPALFNSKYWSKGDLLISLRNKSVVFLYRPATNKILWLRFGIGFNQHCIDFVDSNRISIFGNNVAYNTKNIPRLVTKTNNFYIYDFSKDCIDSPYTNAFLKCDIETLDEGRGKVLKNGDLFIDETDNGRYLRINQNNSIWQFVNDEGKNYVSYTNWGRYLYKTGEGEFNLSEN